MVRNPVNSPPLNVERCQVILVCIKNTMKLKSNLTKRYYFPIVEGSNYGFITNFGTTYNAFVTYIKSPGGVTKVVNYSQVWHWFARKSIQMRKGYYVGWWKEGADMLRELSKANKYLNRQYNRIDRQLQAGDKERAFAIWNILHKRSDLWWLVLIVRKTPFLELSVLRVKALLKGVKFLANRESLNLRYKRVFLPEYKADGSLKKMRPLGVPSIEWRLIAASYEFMLVNVWAGTWAPNQYACMPGRGVPDAWIEILSRFARGDVKNIIGFDLAKFFDTVYLSNITTILWIETPQWFREYLRKLMTRKPLIRPQDRKLEVERLKGVGKERPVTRYQGYGFVGEFSNKLEESFPQGLNISPIMACRALQVTRVLNAEREIIQYVDDGVMITNKDLTDFIEILKIRLKTPLTGIALSEAKTEVIMRDGTWIKPLKFLGCSYDGKTFIADTRKGKYKVEKADERLQEIMYWLKKNGSLLGNYKKLMTSLISEGWNPPKSKWWSVPALQTQGPENNLITQWSTWWEETRVKVTRLRVNSVEAMSIETLGPTLGPITSSSNTATMVGSYYLLRFSKSVKRGLRLRIVMSSVPNRLLADW